MPVQTPKQKKATRVSPAKLKAFFEIKLQAELGPHDLKRRIGDGDADFILVDVRSEDGYQKERIPGAVSIPFEELSNRWKEIPKSKEAVVYCWNTHCLLAPRAALFLTKHGYRVKHLLGGIADWKEAGFPVEK